METLPLEKTKLFIPPGRPGLLLRPRLFSILDCSVNSRLTLVSAAAGFGKTTALSQWIQQNPSMPVAWLSLDTGDNDLTRFLSNVLTALQGVDPRLGQGLNAALRSPEPPPAVAILTTVLNEITQRPAGCVLVLDDYHVIKAAAIHESLRFLIDNLPPSNPKLNMVVSSRGDLPLPTGNMRSRGELCELREAELRFTPDEAAELLDRTVGFQLPSQDIMTLEARTDGCAAGLYLAALTLQGQNNPNQFIHHLTASQRPVLDYLAEELLAKLPDDVQSFLLETSILHRMNGELCRAVTRRSDAGQQLAELAANNHFLRPLDEQASWLSYHPVFAHQLRQQLDLLGPRFDCAPAAELHRRASEWYHQHHLPTEAVEHALAAGDDDVVADLIESNGLSILDDGELATLFRWTEPLPPDLYKTRPRLAVIQCWLLAYSGQIAAVDKLLQAAERAMEGMDDEQELQQLNGHIASIRAYATLLGEDYAYVVVLGRQALELLPADDRMARGFVTMMLGAAHRHQGDLDAAAAAFAAAFEINRQADKTHVAIVAICNLARLQAEQGQLGEAADTYQRAIEFTRQLSPPDELLPFAGLAYAGYCNVLREWNQLEQAREMAFLGVRLCRRWGQQDVLNYATVQQARVLIAAGELSAAESVLEDARLSAANLSTWYMAWVSAYEVRLWLAQDRPEVVQRWVDANYAELRHRLTYSDYEVIISLAMGLLSLRRIEDALVILGRLGPMAEDCQWVECWLYVQVLQAGGLAIAGQHDAALAALNQALIVAEPENITRIFVDQSETLNPLMRRAALSGPAATYAARLLASDGWRAGELVAPVVQSTVPAPIPLSKREQQVLELLAAGLSNQQIADKLILALGTVKKHISNIYTKLGVSHRKEAIARARELNLIHS